MTLVSAKQVTSQSPYAFRFYSTEKQYADPHFQFITKDVYPKLGVLAINDEFGSSVLEVIQQRADEKGIELPAIERFDPGSSDMRSQLVKINAYNPAALIIVASVPIEISSALKQVRELGFTGDIIEASAALAQPAARQASGSFAEGVYTIAFPFSLGLTGQDFHQRYVKTYNKQPSFAAAFGYDMTMLIAKSSKGKSIDGPTLARSITALRAYESLNGNVSINPDGEINPTSDELP